MINKPENYKRYLDLCHSEEYQLLQQFYHKKTLFDILGVARQENPHSSFISWLLNPFESHGMGDFPMKRFLETLCFAYMKYGQAYLTQENPTFATSGKQQTVKERLLFFDDADKQQDKITLRQKLMQGDYTITACNMKREKLLSKQRRADIYIELFLHCENKPYRMLLLIENKVRSGENDEQTKDYLNDLLEESNKKSENDKENKKESVFIVPIFLTPSTNSEMESNAELLFNKDAKDKELPCVSRLFLLLNYQYLMDGVLAPCRTAFKGEHIHDVLTEYVSCLGKSIDDAGNTTAELPVSIMAISREEKEWSKRLWENHQDILLIICQELCGTTGWQLVAQNPSNVQFYRTVLSVILLQKDELNIAEEQTVTSIQNALKTSQRAEYTVKQRTGESCTFVSRKQGKESLGALAYVILKQYIHQNGQESAKDILAKLQHIKHPWLRNILITKKDFDAYCINGNFPVCQRTNPEDGTGTICPLETLKAKIRKKQDEQLLPQYTCPLNPNLSNEALNDWYCTQNKNKLCACLYEVVHYFFVKDLSKTIKEEVGGKDGVDVSWIFEEPIFQNGNFNDTFGAIPIEGGKDFVLVARFWNTDAIESLVSALGMQSYVGKGTAEIKERLAFNIADL